EVVRLEQHVQGVLPPVLVNEVVPLGDDVPERAPVVAERDAAVHAPGALGAKLVLGERVVYLVPVEDAVADRPPLRRLPLVFLEAGRQSHGSTSFVSRSVAPRAV